MPSCKLQFDPLSPMSFALHSMDELRAWVPSDDTFNIPNIALQTRRTDFSRPRLILVHDMAGGYKEDKNIQGNDYESIYYCQYWHLTDMFIYFSHERVSIPPVNWTNACHRNGVQCLGTFLIEGNNQMHEMETLLQGPPQQENIDNDDPMRLWSPFFADKLVSIAKHYKFDGWLINIECEFFPFPISPQYKAQELAKFLCYLTDTIHDEIPGSKIIWYDSMTCTGEIDWQNQLTDKNELFFKNSDGIFLNYWWKKSYPELAHKLVLEKYQDKSSFDVYFGTDVGGKHSYSGDGFKSYKGVKTTSFARTSSALFGVAWTYEHFDKTEFEKMDRLLWCGGKYSDYPPLTLNGSKDNVDTESDDSEDELMYDHKKGIADTISTHSVPGKKWFVTSFDKGFGHRFYFRGKRLLSQPWSHLSHQSILPNLDYQNPSIGLFNENIKITCTLENCCGAFLGGTSLVLQGQRLTYRESRDMEIEISIPLYQLNIDVSRGCTLRYIYKTPLAQDVKLIMSCNFTLHHNNDKSSSVENFCKTWLLEDMLSIENCFRITITSANDSCDCQCFLLSVTEECKTECGWLTKLTQIPAITREDGYRLFINRIELNVIVNTASLVGVEVHQVACLGHLSIIPTCDMSLAPDSEEQISQLTNLKWKDTSIEIVKKASDIPNNVHFESTLSQKEQNFRFFGTISWDELSNPIYDWKATDYYIVSYKVDDEECVFLGTAFCTEYRISGLDCVNKARIHMIIIETVTREGYISSCASLEIIL
ncbi:MAG: endo-b-N-acetylglucosaminidase [Benjaminiella poitrasii]|nr:MAG: endo-b-N-acetylglucosaminidase [Benjaminiella poitrasii]